MSLPEHERELLRELIGNQRYAALATLHNGVPAISMVAYALDGASGLLLHISALAQHTGDLRANPQTALLVCQPDSGETNPQLLHRVSIDGIAHEIPRDSADYEQAKAVYLARLPESTITFSLGDFSLFRIVPSSGRFVAGFGRAYDIAASDIAASG